MPTSLLIGIPSHNRGNVIESVLKHAEESYRYAQRHKSVDIHMIYVHLNDNTDDTVDQIRKTDWRPAVEPVIEEQNFGVRDRFDSEHRTKFIRAVMCQKYNRILDLGRFFDYTIMISSDHLVDVECIDRLISTSKWLSADVVGPRIDSSPHNSGTNLFRRKESGLYGIVPLAEFPKADILHPGMTTVANLLWTREACSYGVRYDIGESVQTNVLFEHRMVEKLFKAGIRVAYDPVATVNHIVSGWTHGERTEKN